MNMQFVSVHVGLVSMHLTDQYLDVIEVRRQAGDQMPAATWSVTRRYSEFHSLNKRLRARFAAVRSLDFPSRQTIFTLQKDFLQKRRVVLERYMRVCLYNCNFPFNVANRVGLALGPSYLPQ